MKRMAIVGLIAAAFLLQPMRASAGPATELVKKTVDQVLEIGHDKSISEATRRARIKKVIVERFGFEEMAKQCLGRYWNDRTPAERDEFIRLFTDLLERTYINDIEAYNLGQEIIYGQERVDGDHVDVPSTVITETRDRVPIVYRLVRSGDAWQVYDLVVDGVSLVSNYRTQFSHIIQTQSYGALIKKLRVKVKTEQATERAPLH